MKTKSNAGRKPIMTRERAERINKILEYLKSEKKVFTFVEINRHFNYPVSIRDDLRLLIKLGLICKKKEQISRFISFYVSDFKISESDLVNYNSKDYLISNHKDKAKFTDDLKRVLAGNELRFLGIHSRLSKYSAKFIEQMLTELVNEKVIQCVIPPQYKGDKFPKIYKWSEII